MNTLKKTVEADRPNCFHHEAYCLLAPKGTKITLTAHSHSELLHAGHPEREGL